MHIRVVSFALLGILFSASLAFADEDWTLDRDEAGVQVYTRPVAGSSFHAFRGKTIVPAELNQVMAVMDDTAACPDWMHQCKSAVLVQKNSPIERYTYMVNDLPWPATDRDVLVHVNIAQEETTRVVTVSLKGVDPVPGALASRIPSRKGKAGIESLSGVFRFTPLSETETVAVYEMHMELGGSLPAGLANTQIADTPYYTLLNLRKLATDPKYRNFRPF